MRKLMLTTAALFFMAGLALAAEVTVVKFDKDTKKLTVKEGDAEKEYKISDKVKVTTTDKDGNKTEGKYEDLERRLGFAGKAGGKGKKGGAMKLDITVEKDEITEVKMPAFGKKKKDTN